jgi:hypothetical protein
MTQALYAHMNNKIKKIKVSYNLQKKKMSQKSKILAMPLNV